MMMILNRNIVTPPAAAAVDDKETAQQNTSRVRRRPSHWKKDTPEDSIKKNTTNATRRRRRLRPVNNKTRCDDDTASTVSASLSSSSSSDEENCNKQQQSSATKSANKPSTTSATKKKSQANNNQRRRRNTTTNKKNKNNNKKSSSPKVIQFPTELTPIEKSQYIALDAEMVGVGPYGQHSRLARITIVNYDGECIYDHHVQVLETVTDYRTHVSGITSEDIAPPSTTTSASSSNDDNDDNNNSSSNRRNPPPIPYEQCQQEVASILHNKIVIGHGLKNDFRVLGLHHPWAHTRDTARYEPFMKKVVADNNDLQQQQQQYHGYNKEYLPKKLKTLAKDKLGLDIQMEGVPHCPMEDATAALELYKKHRVKWECAMRYKIERTREITTSVAGTGDTGAAAVEC